MKAETFDDFDEQSFDYEIELADFQLQHGENAKTNNRYKNKQRYLTKKRIERQHEERYLKKYNDYLDEDFSEDE